MVGKLKRRDYSSRHLAIRNKQQDHPLFALESAESKEKGHPYLDSENPRI